MTLEESARARIAAAIAERDVRRLELVAEVATELLEEVHAARARWQPPAPIRTAPDSTASILAEVMGGRRA